MNTRSITVFCSSGTRVDPRYFDAAARLGRAIAARGWVTVYGGNDVGPMGALATAARQVGGKVVGITPQVFIDQGNGDDACDELIVADSMSHRKHLLTTRADAIVVLPGGIGTLEEFFEVLVGRYLGNHDKPLLLVNLERFFEPLILMIEQMIRQQFVRPEAWAMVEVVPDIESAMRVLTGHFGGGAVVEVPGLAGR